MFDHRFDDGNVNVIDIEHNLFICGNAGDAISKYLSSHIQNSIRVMSALLKSD